MFEKLSDNLNQLLDKQRMSVSQLSYATGIPASTIKKLRNRENMNPTLATLIPIARFFSVSLEHLISDIEIKAQSAANLATLPLNHVQLSKSCPLLTWEKAIHWPHTDDTLCQKVLSMNYYHPQMFALQVETEDWEPLVQGTVLFVDPTILPIHCDYVVIVRKGQEVANLKLFLCDDEKKYLRSMRIVNDVIPLTETHRIIGVVVEYWKQLKKSNKAD